MTSCDFLRTLPLLNFGELFAGDARRSYRVLPMESQSPERLVLTLQTRPSEWIFLQTNNENHRTGAEVPNPMWDAIDHATTLTLPPHGAASLIVSVAVGADGTRVEGMVGSVTIVAHAENGDPRGVIDVPIHATVHSSIVDVITPLPLRMSVPSQSTQTAEFVVVNRSEVPLTMVLRVASIHHKSLSLSVTNDDSGQSKIDSLVTVPRLQSQKFSVSVTADVAISPGQHRLALQCCNVRHRRNKVRMEIVVDVPAVQSDMALPRTVHFTHVLCGSSSHQKLEAANLSDGDLSLTIESGSGGNVGTVSLALAHNAEIIDEIRIPMRRVEQLGLVFTPSQIPLQDGSVVYFPAIVVATRGTKKLRIPIYCSAEIYTSNISVSTTTVTFGNIIVGEEAEAFIDVINESQLGGSVSIDTPSTVLTINGQQSHCVVDLPPRSRTAVNLLISPKRVNAHYQRELTITNRNNPAQRVKVTIESVHIPSEVSRMHDAKYTCTMVCAAPQVTFEALSNTPLLIPYELRSTSEENLTLTFRTSTNEITVLSSVDPNRTGALMGARVELLEIIALLRSMSAPTPEAVEKVEARYQSAVEIVGQAAPIDVMVLQPGEARTIFVAICRTAITTKWAQKEDTLTIGLEGLDVVRSVRLSYALCSSRFTVDQPSKSMDDVAAGERRQLRIALRSCTELPVFFRLRKSRPLSNIKVEGYTESNDAHQGLWGAAAGYAEKRLDTTVYFSVRGVFAESLEIFNALDPTNRVTVNIKANVYKADTFEVMPSTLKLEGTLSRSHLTEIRTKFMLSNTSKTKREFRMKLGRFEEVMREIGVEVITSQCVSNVLPSTASSSQSVEEKIEKLEQKKKIAEKKGKHEKVATLTATIRKLRSTAEGEFITELDDIYESEGEEARTARFARRVSVEDLAAKQEFRDGWGIASLGPSEQAIIELSFSCRLAADGAREGSVEATVFEEKDAECCKVVPVTIRLRAAHLPSPSTFLAHAQESSTSTMRVLGTDRHFLGEPLFELSRMAMHTPTTWTFQVVSDQDADVTILDPEPIGRTDEGGAVDEFAVDPPIATLREGVPLTVRVTVTPRSPGMRRFGMSVRNAETAANASLIVVYTVPVVKCLEVASLVSFGTVVLPCECPPVRALYLRNVDGVAHRVRFTSSRPSQVKVYLDEMCAKELASGCTMQSRETICVYVKFSPAVPPSLGHTAHDLTTGLLIDVLDSNGSIFIEQRDVRISATIGRGTLIVEGPTTIDAGPMSYRDRTTDVSLCLRNPSDRFEVQYRIATTNANAKVVSKHMEGTILPKDSRSITLTLSPHRPGISVESLLIHSFVNKVPSQPPMTVTLTMLKEGNIVRVRQTTLDFGIVAVFFADEANPSTVRLVDGKSATVNLLNSSTSEVQLVAQTGFPINLGKPRQPSEFIRVPANAETPASFVLFDVPALTKADTDALMAHHAVVHRSHVTFEKRISIGDIWQTIISFRSSAQQCVTAARITATFAVSGGALLAASADVGTVGLRHDTVAPISMMVRNLSSVLPLSMVLKCPPWLHPSTPTVEIPPSEVGTVALTLDVHEVPSGPFTGIVRLTNKRNLHNDLAFKVQGTHLDSPWVVRRDDVLIAFENGTRTPMMLPLLKQRRQERGVEILADCKVTIESLVGRPAASVFVVLDKALEDLAQLSLITEDGRTLEGNVPFALSESVALVLKMRFTSTDLKALSAIFFPTNISDATFTTVDAMVKDLGTTSAVRAVGRLHLHGGEHPETIDVVATMDATSAFTVVSGMTSGGVVASQASTEDPFTAVVTLRNATNAPIVVRAWPLVDPSLAALIAVDVAAAEVPARGQAAVPVTLRVDASRWAMAGRTVTTKIVFAEDSVATGVKVVDVTLGIPASTVSKSPIRRTAPATPSLVISGPDVEECGAGEYSMSWDVSRRAEAEPRELKLLNTSTQAIDIDLFVPVQQPCVWLNVPPVTGNRVDAGAVATLQLGILPSTDVGSFDAQLIVRSSISGATNVIFLRIQCNVCLEEQRYGDMFALKSVVGTPKLLQKEKAWSLDFGIIHGVKTVTRALMLESKVSRNVNYVVAVASNGVRMNGVSRTPPDGLKLEVLAEVPGASSSYSGAAKFLLAGKQAMRVIFALNVSKAIAVQEPSRLEFDVTVNCRVIRMSQLVVRCAAIVVPQRFLVDREKMDVGAGDGAVKLTNVTTKGMTVVSRHSLAGIVVSPATVELQPHATEEVRIVEYGAPPYGEGCVHFCASDKVDDAVVCQLGSSPSPARNLSSLENRIHAALRSVLSLSLSDWRNPSQEAWNATQELAFWAREVQQCITITGSGLRLALLMMSTTREVLTSAAHLEGAATSVLTQQLQEVVQFIKSWVEE